MRDWFEKVCEALCDQSALVLISTIAVAGSAPREVGAKMLITEAYSVGTIGGGQLEFLASKRARALLSGRPLASERMSLALGPAAGQCCGGRVELLLEVVDGHAVWPGRARELLAVGDSWICRRLGSEGVEQTLAVGADDAARQPESVPTAWIRSCRMPAVITANGVDWLVDPCSPAVEEVWLFGAGHVGTALVQQLLLLRFRIVWIDQREAHLRALAGEVDIERRLSDDPIGEIADIPRHACVLVMTHSHELDYRLCVQLVKRGGFRFVGLIGSLTKAARFRHRLARRGLDGASIHCPIAPGIVRSRRPEAIALAIATQLTQVCEQQNDGLTHGF